MALIQFTREEKDRIVPIIQTYLKNELDCDIGSFDAEFLLDFFVKEIGGFIYNRALVDVHALLQRQLESMSDSIYELEKPVPYER